MKVKTLSALAGLGGALILSGAAHAGFTGVSVTRNTTDPFLVANNLQSAVIALTGFSDGDRLQGFLGTALDPWTIETSGPGLFFNVAQYEPFPGFQQGGDSFYAAVVPGGPLGANALWDTGALFPSGDFGAPSDGDAADDIGGFAQFSNSSDDTAIDPAAWITIAAGGYDPPAASLNILRLTWSASESAHIHFIVAMNTPASETVVDLTIPPVPAPGALALLGLAGLVGTRRRRSA